MNLELFKENLIPKERSINNMLKLMWKAEDLTDEEIKVLQEGVRNIVEAKHAAVFIKENEEENKYVYASHSFEIILSTMMRTWINPEIFKDLGDLTKLTPEKINELNGLFDIELMTIINDIPKFLEKLDDIKVIVSEIVSTMNGKNIEEVSLDQRYEPLTKPIGMNFTDMVLNLMGMSYDLVRNQSPEMAEKYSPKLTDSVKSVIIVDNIFGKITVLDLVGEENEPIDTENK